MPGVYITLTPSIDLEKNSKWYIILLVHIVISLVFLPEFKEAEVEELPILCDATTGPCPWF